MRVALIASFALFVVAGCGGSARESEAPVEKVEPPKFRVRTAGAGGVRYAIYVPNEYDSRPDWPLIMFIHGWGERGSDGMAPTKVGIGPAVLADPERFPAIVVAPQVPRTLEGDAAMERHYQVIQSAVSADVVGETELDIATGGLARAGYPRNLLDAVFDDVAANFNVDEDRVYLTGISLGGIGAWSYAAANPTRFAALSIISGGGDASLAAYLPHVPIRFYHGAKDDVVPPFNAKRLTKRLRKAGGVADITLFPDRGHKVWDQVYADDVAVDWMLNSRL